MTELLLVAILGVLIALVYGLTNQNKELLSEIKALRKQLELTLTPEFEYNESLGKCTDNGYDGYVNRIYQYIQAEFEKKKK